MNKTKCHIGYGKGNDMITQEYKYEGEEFVITKPEACAMNVSRGEYTATISIHSATNQFRESLEVWPESHWPGFALRQTDVFQSYTAC